MPRYRRYNNNNNDVAGVSNCNDNREIVINADEVVIRANKVIVNDNDHHCKRSDVGGASDEEKHHKYDDIAGDFDWNNGSKRRNPWF
ncbi:hypothetical protein [Oceanobacillus bengalensis]|uniref:Uncharacterized protein n=1 Tax=Oceanobacillus bengalensis TaxID=1435466 RepID=A0A494YSJ3_9BACI|nr:hypothetical protein [Oceanobacillus bengalensis]RKQ12872.1 hypothetical protein D8M05_17525 [Oceanobacillus bengalensis]